MKKILLICLFIFSQNAYTATPFNTYLSAGLTFDDNITNGRDSKDIEKDQILALALTGSYNIPIDNKSKFIINGTLQLEQYQDFDKLSNNEITLSFDYQVQPNQLFTSPWYYLSATVSNIEYDSDFRDGTAMELSLGVGKRITDKIKIIAGFSVYSSDAENNIFDVDYNRLFINTDLKLSTQTTLYTTLSYYDGDIISTNVPPHPAELSGIPWVNDDAYPSLSNPWTYRLDAETLSIRIGSHYTIHSNQAIDVSWLYYDSDAYGNFTYDGSQLALEYLYRF